MTDLQSDLWRTDTATVYFPVRHHSPTCARLLRQLILTMQPDVILIEGPSDFNDQLDELLLPHRLPIAIYSYVRHGERRHGSFYPFCEHSPEWQGIVTGREIGAEVRFIDLPLAEMTSRSGDERLPAQESTHQYADGALANSPYIDRLLEELQLDSFDDLWDTLFEIDETLTVDEFMRRMHHFCLGVRASQSHISLRDVQREQFMAGAIVRSAIGRRSKIGAFSAEKTLIVTGGFHSSALYELVQQASPPVPLTATSDERGIALTPYTYQRLDSLSGYNAGMPNPGFYRTIWADGNYRHLLRRVVSDLRERKQMVSSADLIAVETAARTLANLRGHRRVWRQDLLDGITTALVKEELTLGVPHPFLAAVQAALRGTRRGRLAEGTTLPPLVTDIRQTLETHDLLAEHQPRQQKLNLLNADERQQSRVLHRVRVLSLPGYDWQGRAERERWQLRWQPEFEAAVIEASIYGATLVDAARARLDEQAANLTQPNAAQAADLLLTAALADLIAENDRLADMLHAAIVADGNFFTVAPALNHLLTLYRFDDLLGTRGLPNLGDLLATAVRRAMWLLEMVGDADSADLLTGIQHLLAAYERCGAIVAVDSADFVALFERIEANPHASPTLRGAASGVLWTLGAVDVERILYVLRGFGDPEALGDFLNGLFTLAREAVQHHPALVAAIDTLFTGYDDDQFLRALPSLRLAFTTFSPREKHHLVTTLFEDEKDDVRVDLVVSAEAAARTIQFEANLFAQLEKYGMLHSLK